MFGRPPEGGLLSSCDGVGWTAAKCSDVFQRWTEYERRSLAVRLLCWARLLRLSAALFWSAEPHCKPRLKPMPRASSQAYARPLLDPTLKCSLTYIAPAYRTRLSLLAPNVAYLARLRYLAVENEGVLPEIRWFSSNE